MSHPLLYELNTRCWLRELSQAAGQPVTLANVPQSEFESWQRLGFSHIWLMGVWSTGPRARECSLNRQMRPAYSDALPDWSEADVVGSPYAVADYLVPPALGGDEGLRAFRDQLRSRGLKLLLDFVPNHLGLDHPWLRLRPYLFVQSNARAPGTFLQPTNAGPRWLAHGKDPNFPPWTDTVQLDYRRAETRRAMAELLRSIAERCDGVRCDMAMLVLNEVFERTWQQPPSGEPMPQEEFWPAAIAAAREKNLEFLMLAEAYWGLESKLQALGFDYTYDKALYDQLVARDGPAVQRYLLELSAQALAAGAHFLENHDEPRIASLLDPTQQRAAALLILAIPGMRFLHDGQLSGARHRVPVQLQRRPIEPKQAETERSYEQLLTTLAAAGVGSDSPDSSSRCGLVNPGSPGISPSPPLEARAGETRPFVPPVEGERISRILAPREAWPGNPTSQNIVLVQWQQPPGLFVLAVVNLAGHRSQCYAPLNMPDLVKQDWLLRDLLSDERYVRHGQELQTKGLYLDVPSWAAQLFKFEPAP